MKEAEKSFKQGTEFFKSGEYETAIRYFTNAIVDFADKESRQPDLRLLFEQSRVLQGTRGLSQSRLMSLDY
jgi:pterin-4a-carbinolamine dehydratase